MSLLITTRKELSDIQTLNLNHWGQYMHDVKSDGSDGLSIARNRLAEKAETSLLVFMDDDLEVDEEVWGEIANLSIGGKGKLLWMAEGSHHPISRVMVMTKETFDDVGGFDESIQYNGEDYDFYLSALKKGYWVKIIPKSLIKHKEHKKGNWWHYHFESPKVRIKHHKVGFNFFVYRNPLVMLLRVSGFIYYKWIKPIKPPSDDRDLMSVDGI